MKFSNRMTGKKDTQYRRHCRRAGVGRRPLSLLLCLCMLLPMLTTGFTNFAANEATAQSIIANRASDADTMDEYIDKLLNDRNGSRYAGRVWTDKTVFAFGEKLDGGDWDGAKLQLKKLFDGYEGEINSYSDFLHVFSALTSTQLVNEYPPSPVDLVIVFDMSGSMGQDTRYSIDSDNNAHKNKDDGWPDGGVEMSDRIAHSRVQATLNAINKTVTELMRQNPQNRVAVVGYGANATVIMPLAHWKLEDDVKRDSQKVQTFLKVGGMETLYAPGNLKAVQKNGSWGWYWQNNRDTAYTVVAKGSYSTDIEKKTKDLNNYTPYTRTVSNNVSGRDGALVRALPGDQTSGTGGSQKGEQTEEILKQTAEAHKSTPNRLMDNQDYRMDADEYVGYFTNTQGGIYLGYKQLADSKVTTYSETLSNGEEKAVARIPSVVIMSDGGANFAFNPMGTVEGDQTTYHTYEKWKEEFGKLVEKTEGDKTTKNYESDSNGTSGLDKSYQLNRSGNNIGDEWYNVWLPGADSFNGTLGDGEDFTGLLTLFNKGADDSKNGTLIGQPNHPHRGVLYCRDNNVDGTAGTVMEVLLTASYMSSVVEKYYQNGWAAKNAEVGSKTKLSTYTMNVDTPNVPTWGRMRLYPSLDPKEYSPNSVESWCQRKDLFGDSLDSQYFTDGTKGLKGAWESFKTEASKEGSNTKAKAQMQNNVFIGLAKLPEGHQYTAGDKSTIPVTNADVVNNIAYNDAFYDVTSENLSSIFSTILTEILGQVFVPITGGNDAGVGDALTYQDPIGDYMQLKDQSIAATPFHRGEDGKNSLENAKETTYDMAMLLFGEMHGLTRAGVYDFQWNDKFMDTHHKEDGGKKAMVVGWYRGDDPTKTLAEYKTQSDTIPDQKNRPAEKVEYVDSATMSTVFVGTDKKYADLNAVWNDGWVLRLSYKDLINYVPIVNTTVVENGQRPIESQLPDSVKYTAYTLYRFSCTQEDRNTLRMNPVYGDSVPEDVQDRWDKYKEENNGTYPETGEIYAGTSGVYRLSDIRVWLEEYGDYKDTNGAITPNNNVYDASVYCNVPVAALPTQVAEITLGPDGVASYKTNVMDTKRKDYSPSSEDMKKLIQSTPLRLFYGVGLSDDLIIKDEKGDQVGVDVSKISAEYIESHTVKKEDGSSANRIYFLSNYYSATNYDGYTTDNVSRTRGDPTVSFSPGESNRYYVFQKPLPLYAHAYRVSSSGSDSYSLKPVDKKDGNTHSWDSSNRAGNGAEGNQWEEYGGQQQNPGSWAGGYYIGVYKDEQAFQTAMTSAKKAEGSERSDVVIITDANGDKYKVWTDSLTDAIVFLESDRLDRVTSESTGGYASGSVSFSSDDWFFLPVDFYVPNGEDGVDLDGKSLEGTSGADAVQYIIARKGSEFGSGLHAKKINNGDMLCWTDMSGKLNIPFEYNSRTETGDNTRGEPTYELLFGEPESSEQTLDKYLEEVLKKLGVTNDGKGNIVVRDADGNPVVQEDGTVKTDTPLAATVAYWTAVRTKYTDILSKLKAEYAAWKSQQDSQDKSEQDWFNAAFRFTVAAKPGGLRTGDMAQNRGAKGEGRLADTAYNYYLPTISESSGIGADTVINNYLGNNGRLEIYNQELLVTKTLTPPAGKALTAKQADKEFFYQVYIQSAKSEMGAIVAAYNEYAEVWQRKLGTVDILTDNADLLLDSSGSRVLFDPGENGSGARMVVAVGTNGDTKYYYANEDGTADMEQECEKSESGLYYVYLPQNTAGVSGSEHSRRIYVDPDLEGEKGGKLENSGRTTYVPEGAAVPADKSADGTELLVDEKYDKATENHPAGTREYWVSNAELIPVSEVQAAEGTNADLESLPDESEPVFFLMASEALEEILQWSHKDEDGGCEHTKLNRLPVLIRKPTDNSDVGGKDTIISPYQIRTQYLIKTLKFGVNANADGDGKDTGNQQLVWPTDFYGETSIGNSQQANSVAEFTLKSGEGLVFSGLSGVNYWFTEKLIDKDVEKGYVLDRIRYITNSTEDSTEFTPAGEETEQYKHTSDAYSVKGRLAEFEDQVHYINTIDLDNLILQKAMEDKGGNAIGSPPTAKFKFTLTFANTDEPTLLPDKLYYRIQAEGKLDSAPRNLEYDKTGNMTSKGVQTLPKGDDGSYTVELAVGEAAVFYDLYPGTTYTITETFDPTYPLKKIDGGTGQDLEKYSVSGTILHHDDSVSWDSVDFQNAVKFTNRMALGTLTVKKMILDDDAEEVEKIFTFSVTLAPPKEDCAKEALKAATAAKYAAEDPADDFSFEGWQDNDGDGVYETTFQLRHGEKIVLSGIPVGSHFTVTETGRDGYNLQHVADNENDTPTGDGNYLPLVEYGVVGEITTDAPDAYRLFVNGKPPYLPFTGNQNPGAEFYRGMGLMLILAGLSYFTVMHRKRRTRSTR